MTTITLNNLREMKNKLVAENADAKVVAASAIVAEENDKEDNEETGNAVDGLKELKAELTKTNSGSIELGNIEGSDNSGKSSKKNSEDDDLEDISLSDDDTIEIYDGEDNNEEEDENEDDGELEVSDVSLSDDDTIEIYGNDDENEPNPATDDDDDDDEEDGDENEDEDEDEEDEIEISDDGTSGKEKKIPIDEPIEIEDDCNCHKKGCNCGCGEIQVVEDGDDSTVRVCSGFGGNPHLLIKVSNIKWDADEDEIEEEGLPTDTTVEVEVNSDYDAGDVRDDVYGELSEISNGYEAEDFDIDMAKISDTLESLNFDEVSEGRHVSGRKERRERKLKDKTRKSRQYKEASSDIGGKTKNDWGILGDAVEAIGNGIWGLIKILGRGLIVVAAGVGGSFLLGLPGLLLATLVAFGLVGGKGVMESKDINQNKKSLLKKACGLFRKMSKQDLKDLNNQVKSGGVAGLQAVAAKIRKMVNAGDDEGKIENNQQANNGNAQQQNQVSEGDKPELKDIINPDEIEGLDDKQKAAYAELVAAQQKENESVSVRTPKQIIEFLSSCKTYKDNKPLRESTGKFSRLYKTSPKKANKIAVTLESEFGKKVVTESSFCRRFCELVNESENNGGWFNIIGRGTAELAKDLPEECIEELSGSGDKTSATEMWVEELGFDKDIPVDIFKKYIRSTGTDDDPEKMSETDMAEFVLWSICNDIKEERAQIESNKEEYIEEYGEEEYEKIMNHSAGMFSIEGY